MSAPIRIAIDAMGGDFGPQPVVASALRIAAENPFLEILIVGEQSLLQPLLSHGASAQIKIVHAPDVVTMQDKPATVLRHKQASSMWRALELVKDGSVAACVSCGNTGALMAMGKYLLKTFPGIDRPAICKAIPSTKGHCYLLDLGANINCTADQLVQFAFMGAMLAKVSDNLSFPSVGLLNIGEENIKGIEQVRVAAELLKANSGINYRGFVEGNDIFLGNVDVVVCDGFVGNIALKVSEGAAKFLATSVKDVFTANWYGRLVGLVAAPIVNKWRAQYDPARYNGACFLGLQGTVIKSHGSADTSGLYYALQMAVDHVRHQLPEKINAQFEDLVI